MCRWLVKSILFVVNLIFTLLGLLVVGLGVFAIFQLRAITDKIAQNEIPIEINLDFVPYFVIGIGVGVFLISFSGCCGAITETKCLLITYAVCMAVFAAAKIVLSILVFANLPKLTKEVENSVNNMFASEDTFMNGTFHLLESQFKCCGTIGPESYVNEYNMTSPTCCDPNGNYTTTIPIDNLPGNVSTVDLPSNLPANYTEYLPANYTEYIPEGLLELLPNGGNLTLCSKEDAYQTGCTALLGQVVTSYVRYFGYGLIGAICFEVLALSFSIYMIRTMESKPVVQHRYYYQ